MVLLAQLSTYLLPKGAFTQEPMPQEGAAFAEAADEAPLRIRLAAARVARGLGHAELAALFEVSPETVRGWELGPPGPEGTWTGGTQIEATVGRLLDRWVREGTAPSAAELAAWKQGIAAHERVVPGTYRVVTAGGELPWHAMLTRLLEGLQAAGDVIFFVFLVGGTIALLRATGAIDALIGRAITRLGHRPVWLIAGITSLLAVGSSTIGMAEEYMPFVPVLVTLCLALKLDAVVAMAIIYVGAGVGYGAAAINPFTVVIGQRIAGLEPTSGQWFRWCFLAASLAVAVPYIVRYARRVHADPQHSLVRDVDYSEGYELPADVPLTRARLAMLLAFAAGVVLFVVGIKWWDWYFAELSAVFVGLAILGGVLGRLSPNRAAATFCAGAADMTTTALLIGVARTIQVVLDEGQVLATIVNGVAGVLQEFGGAGAALGMLVVQSLCNLFVPSGSGQAYVTMPIMAPIADLTDVTRQTAVLCYQIGDGFTNMIVPTNALLMGMLALARVPYQRWLRFVMPLMVQLYLVAVAAVLLANAIGY